VTVRPIDYLVPEVPDAPKDGGGNLHRRLQKGDLVFCEVRRVCLIRKIGAYKRVGDRYLYRVDDAKGLPAGWIAFDQIHGVVALISD